MIDYNKALIDLRFADYPDGEEEYQLLKEAASKATAVKPYYLLSRKTDNKIWYCGTCNTRIKDTNNYCSKCGQKIDKDYIK